MMKKILLMMMIILLLSACGLFKNKSKVIDKVINTEIIKTENQSKTDVSESTESKFDKKMEKSSSQSENNQSRQTKDLDDKTRVEADEITFNKNGSIKSAKGNVKFGRDTKDQGVNETQSNKNSNQNKATQEVGETKSKADSTNEFKAATELKNKSENIHKKSESKPGLWTTIGLPIGLAIAGLLVIFFILRYLGVSPNSVKNFLNRFKKKD